MQPLRADVARWRADHHWWRHLSAILVDPAASCFALCSPFFMLFNLFKCSDRLVVLVIQNDNMRFLFVAAGCCCSCFVVLNGDFIKYAVLVVVFFVVALKLCCFFSFNLFSQFNVILSFWILVVSFFACLNFLLLLHFFKCKFHLF